MLSHATLCHYLAWLPSFRIRGFADISNSEKDVVCTLAAPPSSQYDLLQRFCWGLLPPWLLLAFNAVFQRLSPMRLTKPTRDNSGFCHVCTEACLPFMGTWALGRASGHRKHCRGTLADRQTRRKVVWCRHASAEYCAASVTPPQGRQPAAAVPWRSPVAHPMHAPRLLACFGGEHR